MRPSKGVHIVVPRDRIDSTCALILPTEKSVLFVLPWGEQWIIGTTDTDWEFGLDHPSATRADIDYLLGHANAILRDQLTMEDITAVYVGLRPLVGLRSKDTADVSREHVVHHSAPGLVSIAGGKYTTYRIMARDAVDVAARDLPVPGRADAAQPRSRCSGAIGVATRRPGRCCTPAPPGSRQSRSATWCAGTGRSPSRCSSWSSGEPDLAEPLSGARRVPLRPRCGSPCCTRRRCTWTTCSRAARTSPSRAPTAGRHAVEHVARLMATALAWDPATVDHEVAHYRARLDAESAAQSMLDDASSAPPARPCVTCGSKGRLRRRRRGGRAVAAGLSPARLGGTRTSLPTCRFSRNSAARAAMPRQREGRGRSGAELATLRRTGRAPGTPARPTPCSRSA